MPTLQQDLQAILARKPDYGLLDRADASVPKPSPEPLPEPPYTEHHAPLSECQTWLAQGLLYALIDGLDLPDLPGQINQRHPDVDVALYDGLFGAHHELETPRFTQMDTALMDWLQPVMETDPGWGWCLILRDDLAGLSPDTTIKTLVDHFRQYLWVKEPQNKQESEPVVESWIFRLHDPRVLSNWLQCATAPQIAHFLSPLRHVLIHEADAVRVLTPRTIEMRPNTDLASPPPWPASTFQAMHRIGQEDLLQRLQNHLRAQHPGVQDWPDEQLRQFMMENGNRAYDQGFKNEQAMSKYLSLCVLLGADFDTREDGQWARDMLDNHAIQGQQSRIDRLIQGALDYLDRTPSDAP